MDEPAAEPQSPPPGWQAKVRRWWETWIWRPAPPDLQRRPRRGAAARAADNDREDEGSLGEEEAAAPAPPPLAGTVHLIPISHLDTQWRWTVRESAATLLPKTVSENAAAFEAFPAYRVNFDGAFRYRLLAEHHPQLFAEVRRWVDAGRWCVAGATWDAMDVNLPAPESLVRHVLYGRRWFRAHLGRDPRDLFLPDCFGFGAQVPIVAAHCGLVGFATSKLRRFEDVRVAFGVPFPLGWWQGMDGSRLLAVLDPGGYGEPLDTPPAKDAEVASQLRRHQTLLGEGVAVRFFGIGDRGGAPPRRSLETLQQAVAAEGPITTVAAGSDETLQRLARELPADRLPVWRRELLLREHGTGCYTSQQGMKRWNASNERLAAAAERAATAAAWLGAAEYPAERLRGAWQRFLSHQFHDDLTGTSIPAAYRISWHDEAIAASAFASVLRGAVSAVARGLDTRAGGTPLVVFNPVPRRRRELVAARVPWRGGAGVTVVGPDGEALPAQLEDGTAVDAGALVSFETRAAAGERTALVRFLADLPPLGFAVFDVREETAPAPPVVRDPELRALPRGLESGRYRLLVDAAGNLSSLFDHQLGRDLLASPLRLDLFADRSPRFPAWEVRWQDLERGAVDSVGGPATMRVLAGGPAAVALEVRRGLGRSRFVETYRLSADPAAPVELAIAADWRQRGRLLKLTLNAAASARDAVFDAGVAGVARGPAGPGLYEVPAQAWADLPDESGGWGLALLTDRAGGWDHPMKHVLRRTLVRTPAVGRRFRHQGFQDLGRHRWELRLASHRGDWRAGDVPAMAEGMRHPPASFVVEASNGPLGRSWSFLEVEGGEVAALKEHEDGGEWVLRLFDPCGRGGRARVTFAAAVESSRELDGCEDSAPALDVERPAFRPTTHAVRLSPPREAPPSPRFASVELPFDRTVVTRSGEPSAHGLGRRGLCFPAELWPARVEVEGTPFALAAAGAQGRQAVACRGQRLPLPAGDWQRLWLLVAAGDAEVRVELAVGAAAKISTPVVVPSAVAPLACEDQASGFGFGPLALWRVRPGFHREGAVAWTVDHAHDRQGRDVAYTPLSLFAVDLAIAPGTSELLLPDAPEVFVFALSLAAGAGWATLAGEATSAGD
ncbi:MAG TPA: glycoside hydrolase family 38 C-terminal domain-containing protein [Thermoanaerobaculia bacterium]|nr:glycoside hydrolase family 38 C-terminal domain-containing protein [Thermoanaerobaculia bacterium]